MRNIYSSIKTLFLRPYRVSLSALLISALLISGPAHAFLNIENNAGSVDLSAGITTTQSGAKDYNGSGVPGHDGDIYGTSSTELRIMANGAAGDSTRFEIHLAGDVLFTSMSDGSISMATGDVSGTPARYRYTKGPWLWASDDGFRANLGFERMNIMHSIDNIDITIGRQAINFSQAYFWNPLDVFAPFRPEEYNRDYKPGVDAIRLDLSLGPFSGLSLVGAAGRELVPETLPSGLCVSAEDFEDEPAYGSALMLRFRTNIHEWDLSLQAGKAYGGYQIGTGFSGEWLSCGIRGEASCFRARPDREVLIADTDSGSFDTENIAIDNFSSVIGIDYRFDNSLYVNSEYLFNSQGDVHESILGMARMAVGQNISLGPHLIGMQITYEIHPLLSAQLIYIQSLPDKSYLASPTLSYSVSNESDLVCGTSLCSGKGPDSARLDITDPSGNTETYNIIESQSEFGSYPSIFFIEFKAYF